MVVVVVVAALNDDVDVDASEEVVAVAVAAVDEDDEEEEEPRTHSARRLETMYLNTSLASSGGRRRFRLGFEKTGCEVERRKRRCAAQ